MERLDKLLAQTGRFSRSEARELVKAGRVTVNGTRVRDYGLRLDAEASVLVDGTPVATEAAHYLMLNKPAGVVSSTRDPRDKTVIDLLPEHLQKAGLFPVGRLDKDAEGLLLLTSDGSLAHHLTSPKRHVEKVYFVRIQGVLQEEDILAFSQGLILKDGTKCQPAKLEIGLTPNEGFVTIQEGKYHQVKRMVAARGKKVLYLKRISMGPLQLDELLNPGEFRPLSQEEKEILGGIL